MQKHRDFEYHDDHLNTILNDKEIILDCIRYYYCMVGLRIASKKQIG